MIAAGRPLRALALFTLAALLWLVTRVPGIEHRLAETLAAIKPAAPRPQPERMVVVDGPPAVAVVLREIRLRRLGPVAPDPVFRRPVATVVTEVTPIIRGPGPPAPAAGGNAQPVPAIPGFDLATQAYARLAAGDRRSAERLFAAALAAGPDAPQAGDWARERRRLNRRWSGDAYVLWRDTGSGVPAGGAAATPVLGGGQSGANLAYTLDPLARQPLAVIGRLTAAHSGNGIDPATAQAAIGVRWQPAAGVSIAAERLIALGTASSGDWNLRIAAGGAHTLRRVTVDGYAEAGVRANGDVYAGGQAHAMLPLGRLGPLHLAAGPGAWGSVQAAGSTVGRVDLGAGVTARLPAGLAIAADWRWRVAGNAAPGSGPVVTASIAF